METEKQITGSKHRDETLDYKGAPRHLRTDRPVDYIEGGVKPKHVGETPKVLSEVRDIFKSGTGEHRGPDYSRPRTQVATKEARESERARSKAQTNAEKLSFHRRITIPALALAGLYVFNTGNNQVHELKQEIEELKSEDSISEQVGETEESTELTEGVGHDTDIPENFVDHSTKIPENLIDDDVNVEVKG